VTVEVDPAALERNDEVALALARELLVNATRHSGAQAVTVRLAALDGAIELEVSDDGEGMEPSRPRDALATGHIGLASVEQRVAAVGGRFELETAPGQGTRARATLPDQPSG
jgi:two-component system NarL family sensor kinase